MSSDSKDFSTSCNHGHYSSSTFTVIFLLLKGAFDSPHILHPGRIVSHYIFPLSLLPPLPSPPPILNFFLALLFLLFLLLLPFLLPQLINTCPLLIVLGWRRADLAPFSSGPAPSQDPPPLLPLHALLSPPPIHSLP